MVQITDPWHVGLNHAQTIARQGLQMVFGIWGLTTSLLIKTAGDDVCT